MAEIYRWQAEGPDGHAITDGLPVAEFPSQSEAEAWLTQEWELYADAGATSVTLLRDDQVVYGPMSLAAEH